ncbi:unnamed protein product [Protopolystoma xenopodis]|uniref:Uncharacterized protein n=1 Tax=Protopolystoma xenopodis TaxID=117903 RepID=A0A448WH62_9PLAT|nr:unnamed protein product [Protopolystoma xenopodis]
MAYAGREKIRPFAPLGSLDLCSSRKEVKRPDRLISQTVANVRRSALDRQKTPFAKPATLQFSDFASGPNPIPLSPALGQTSHAPELRLSYTPSSSTTLPAIATGTAASIILNSTPIDASSSYTPISSTITLATTLNTDGLFCLPPPHFSISTSSLSVVGPNAPGRSIATSATTSSPVALHFSAKSSLRKTLPGDWKFSKATDFQTSPDQAGNQVVHSSFTALLPKEACSQAPAIALEEVKVPVWTNLSPSNPASGVPGKKPTESANPNSRDPTKGGRHPRQGQGGEEVIQKRNIDQDFRHPVQTRGSEPVDAKTESCQGEDISEQIQDQLDAEENRGDAFPRGDELHLDSLSRLIQQQEQYQEDVKRQAFRSAPPIPSFSGQGSVSLTRTLAPVTRAPLMIPLNALHAPSRKLSALSQQDLLELLTF